MSYDFVVTFEHKRLPDAADWQNQIRAWGIDFAFDPAFQPSTHAGMLPVSLNGEAQSFEYHLSIPDAPESKTGPRSRISLCSSVDEGDTAPARAAALALAKLTGGIFCDPQIPIVGEYAEVARQVRLPDEKWLSRSKNAKTRLRSAIRYLTKELLEPLGFHSVTPAVWERRLEHTVQSFEIQTSRGRFTFNTGWGFTNHPLHEPIGGMWQRPRFFLSELSGRTAYFDWWDFENDETLRAAIELLFGGLRRRVLPFLEEHTTVEAIVASYEKRRFTASEHFGQDGGWQHFCLGHCYATLGNTDRAINYLQKVIAEQWPHRGDVPQWFIERAEAARATLSRIQGAG